MTWFALVESNTTGTGRDFAVAARRHGLRPVLLTRTRWRYPYVTELGLDVSEVDTGSVEAVVSACRRLRPVGITSSSEYFVSTAAAVAGRLGLPAPDPAAVECCRDKAVQRERLATRAVPVPDFAVCHTGGQARDAARALAGPVVVKPARGSGSQGVRACDDPSEAGEWAAHLLTDAEKVLVEREIRGPEYSAELVDAVVVGLTAKHLGPRPYFVETGHDFPAPVSPRVADALAAVARDALDAVGLTTGPAHVELRLSDEGGPQVIEINPRLAGGLIPRLIRYATGRDLIDEVVAAACGRSARPVDPVTESGVPPTVDRAATVARRAVAESGVPPTVDRIATVARRAVAESGASQAAERIATVARRAVTESGASQAAERIATVDRRAVSGPNQDASQPADRAVTVGRHAVTGSDQGASQPAERIAAVGRHASVRFVVPPRTGVVSRVDGVRHARALPGVVEVECSVAGGSRISLGNSFVDRKGHAIAVGADARTAAEVAERAVERIVIEYEEPGGDRDAGRRTA